MSTAVTRAPAAAAASAALPVPQARSTTAAPAAACAGPRPRRTSAAIGAMRSPTASYRPADQIVGDDIASACHDGVVASLAGYPITAPPLPPPVAFDQFWADLTFVHWPVDPTHVAHLYPPGTRPDVFRRADLRRRWCRSRCAARRWAPSLPLPYFGTFARDQRPAVLDRRRRPPRCGVPVAGDRAARRRAGCPRRTRCAVYLGEDAHHPLR